MEYLLLMDAKTTLLGITAIVTIIAVHRNSVINRRRATVDLVLHQRSDSKLIQANALINPLITSNRITRLSDDSEKDSDERKALLAVLNSREFVATGIRENAFDFKLYKRMNYSMVVRDWKCFKPFVYDLRRQANTPTLFQEFEWLATKFNSRPLKTNKQSK